MHKLTPRCPKQIPGDEYTWESQLPSGEYTMESLLPGLFVTSIRAGLQKNDWCLIQQGVMTALCIHTGGSWLEYLTLTSVLHSYLGWLSSVFITGESRLPSDAYTGESRLHDGEYTREYRLPDSEYTTESITNMNNSMIIRQHWNPVQACLMRLGKKTKTKNLVTLSH
jgi:hypothetical protein